MPTLDYAQTTRRPPSLFGPWLCYSLAYLLITPLFAITEELWGESLNNVFVSVASLYHYATARAGWLSISSFFWIGLPLNALAYGLLLASVHRCSINALRRATEHEITEQTERTRKK
jgi:hypothetical protein